MDSAIGEARLGADPSRYILAAALVATVGTPPGVLPASLPRAATVGFAAVVVWLACRIVDLLRHRGPSGNPTRRRSRSVVVVGTAALALTFWCAVSAARSTDPRVSIGWVAGFVVGVIAVVVLGRRADATVLARTWVVVSVPLAVFAVAESYLGANPLVDLFGANDPQHWSVYRSHVTFGHPLTAGTFFVGAAALAFFDARWSRGWYGRVAILASIVSVAAVLTTVSRGSVVALTIGLVAGVSVGLVRVVVSGRRQSNRPWLSRIEIGTGRTVTRVAVVLAITALAVVAVDRSRLLASRLMSRESGRSTEARNTGLEVALDGARRSPWWGTGPGTSQSGVAEVNPTDVTIENSFLQLLLSIGVPGLVLFVTLVTAAVVVACRRGDSGAVAATVAVVVSVAGYNFIDARLGHLVLLGAVLLIAVRRERSSECATGSTDPAETTATAQLPHRG